MTTGLETRFADTRPSTFDAESRTVEVVAATESPVQRRDMRGSFQEVLRVSDDAVDLTRMEGAPVLDSHNRFELDGVIGRVEGARIEAGELRARLRFSGRDDVAGIVRDVRDGIISRVSVGYTVQQAEDAGAARSADNGERVRRITKWTPREVSLVAIPADDNATVRSSTMANEDPAPAADTQPGTPSAPSQGQAAVTTRGEPAQPGQGQPTQTRASASELRSIAQTAGLGDDFVDRCLDAGMTGADARAAAMQQLENRTSNAPMGTGSRVSLVHDHEDPANVRTAMADALASRFTGEQPQGRAQEFARFDELSMAADLAQRRGGRLDPRDRHGVAETLLSRQGQHVSSDFPALLEDAANKIFLSQYQQAAPTYRRWAARRSFNDFRAHRFLRAGDFPKLKEMHEGGELDYGTLSENKETVTAGEYARGISIGRKMMVNGEFMSATGDFATLAAQRTAADENSMVYSLISGDGPKLSDGFNLFDASNHGNKASTGSAISVSSIGDAVAALRAQKSLDGIPLNLQPTFLLCGPEKELEARQVLANINPDQAANVNPWAGTMNLVVDANISGKRWYVATAPSAAPSIVFGYVAGNTGPQLSTEIDFDTRALKVRLWLDFGTGAIDYRGIYLNEGA